MKLKKRAGVSLSVYRKETTYWRVVLPWYVYEFEPPPASVCHPAAHSQPVAMQQWYTSLFQRKRKFQFSVQQMGK